MRTSKSRSRSKQNRNRSVGNVVNRVFDSSGPEGKVRGTPQQIIEKYNQLARDSQLSNDRVSTENFQQHAEHYQRLLGQALKEQEARRESIERENRERQAERDRERQEKSQQLDRDTSTNEEFGQDPVQPEQLDSSEVSISDDKFSTLETPETEGSVAEAEINEDRKVGRKTRRKSTKLKRNDAHDVESSGEVENGPAEHSETAT